jgi:peptide-methionine (S)-S-oxide reductase
VRSGLSGLVAAAVLIAGGPRETAQTPVDGPARAVVVLAGGCYWGVESVFRHVRGVLSATSGYATPASTDTVLPDPVEAVRIVYDPSRITYRQILDVFFLVAHDPTQRNRQGPDVGAEYRSVAFVTSDRAREGAQAVIDSLAKARAYPDRIVTEIAALGSFREVGADQQNYAARHPTDPYIVTYDVPRLKALRRRFPGLYRS